MGLPKDVSQGDTILESEPGSTQGQEQQQGRTRARPSQGHREWVTAEKPQLGRALWLDPPSPPTQRLIPSMFLYQRGEVQCREGRGLTSFHHESG